MEVLINGKTIMDCNLEELEVLIDNPDYRENQYIDYKKGFAFIEVPKDFIEKENVEFRNDICSFANADGGYLIYGIKETQGIAKELVGVCIDNPDKFEMSIRNKLMSIFPKRPPVSIKFVLIDQGKYIVIIKIDHDYYAPYIHVEGENSYKVYKRAGNQKTIMSYTELKNMFLQSRLLEDEICEFRNRRIRNYSSLSYLKQQYMLFHLIPESFMNESKPLFLLEKKNNKSFGAVFSCCAGLEFWSIPCVDGLRYENPYGKDSAILYNNGMAEYYLSLEDYLTQAEGNNHLLVRDLWSRIDQISQGYRSEMIPIYGNQRYFGCISIIGCKGVINGTNGYGKPRPMIDRNEMICSPVLVYINNEDNSDLNMKKFHLEFLLALGIRHGDEVTKLINELVSYV